MADYPPEYIREAEEFFSESWAEDSSPSDPVEDIRRYAEHVANQSGYQSHVFVMSPTLAHQWRRWGLYVEQLEEMVEKLPRWSPSRYHANALLKRTMGNTLKHRLRRRWWKLKWRFQNDDELDG